MARVKCNETNEIGSSEEFFKAPDGHYYKSEEVYNIKLLRNKCIDMLMEYAGYKDSKYAPSLLFKIINEVGNDVGFRVLFQLLTDWKDAFLWANNNKDFASESGRLTYYRSIITNHVIDTQNKLAHQKEVEDENERISKMFEGVDINIENPKQKGI